jgi:hypothetical protein
MEILLLKTGSPTPSRRRMSKSATTFDKAMFESGDAPGIVRAAAAHAYRTSRMPPGRAM